MSFVEKRIKHILKECKIEFEETEHEAVYTSQQMAQATGHSDEAGIKSMIFRTKEGEFILVLNPGNKEVDTKKIARIKNTKSLFLAQPNEVEKVAGTPIGCVPPFGHKTKVKTYLSEELLKCEYLYFNPGSHTRTIKIKSKDLLKLLSNPTSF